MLRQASVAIARQSQRFTAVARTPASLKALAEEIGTSPARLQSFLALDWDHPDQFVAGLAEHFAQTTQPSLVLAWLHDAELGPRIASAMSPEGTRCDFFQVVGSSAKGAPEGAAFDHLPGLAYYQVLLGFKLEGVSSRWLTDDEISSGVLDAVARAQPSYIVGTTTPRDRRPENAA